MTSISLFSRLAIVLFLASLFGCQESVVPSFPPPDTRPKIVGASEETVPVATPSPDRETWSAIFMDGKKIGYMHFAERTVEENGKKLLHARGYSELTLVRERSRLLQKLELQTWETPDGKLERFESKMPSGSGDIAGSGKRRGAQLIVTTDTLGKRVTTAIPWPENCGGFFVAERSLETSPLKAGEKRTVSGLMPGIFQPCETVLTALEEEEVDLRGLKQKLLKVQQDLKIGASTLTTFCWINAKGETLKTFDPTFGQEAYRTTKELALDKTDQGTIDLLEVTTVKLKGELPQTRPLKQAVYLARLSDKTYPDQFASDEFQKVEKVDDHTARLIVTQLDRESKVDAALVGDKPTAADSAPNSLIQSDDETVIALANALAPPDTKPLVVALALEKGVRQHISKRNYGQAFATAAEVVRSQEGDCTEHAVLLAAACRARKIPARVVLGLVFYPPQNGFAYHMWNEVWIDDRWVPLDATVAQGTVGADHIKLRHSNLQGQSALAVMLPLLSIVKRLELEVERAE
jgi:hypothetical protein